MNGMSPITSACVTARLTAPVSIVISSMVAGTVEAWPRTTFPAESPTRTRSTPAASTMRPVGWSYAVIIKIAHRAAHDGQLLGVLRPEVDTVGRDQVQQLEDDRGDACEVARPGSALVAIGHACDLDSRGEPLRIHLLHGGGEHLVDALLCGDPPVAVLVARVPVEVLAGGELRRVHEQAHDDAVVLRP